MISNEIGWASFYNDASTDFSRSFQTEMAAQLLDQFDAQMESENFAKKKKLTLFVGMEDMKMTHQNGYAFALVEVITASNVKKFMTAFWTGNNVEEIHRSDNLDSTNIQFGWCADFDKQYFLGEPAIPSIADIHRKVLGFEYAADFSLYPDLSFRFHFETTPSDDELADIRRLCQRHFKEAYVSDLIRDGECYLNIVDFQATDFEKKGLFQINQFVTDLRKVNSPIKALSIE